MRSKISCFNMTIFKKNLTMYWPVWLVYQLVLLFVLPVSLHSAVSNVVRWYDGTTDIAKVKYDTALNIINSCMNPVVVFIFAFICAGAVFLYLYNARSCNMIHAFPVDRSRLYITNYIT